MARLVFDDLSGSKDEVFIDSHHPIASVGRSSDCTIRSNRKSVSRKHAEFRYLGNDGYEVIDLNSSNGTYIIINGERQKVQGREYLSDGDEVWCGDFILHFYDDTDEDDVYEIIQNDQIIIGGSDASLDDPSDSFASSNDFESLYDEKVELENELAKQTIELNERSAELSDLRAEYNKLQHKLNELENSKESETSVPPEELLALQKEIERLTKDKEELESSNQTLKEENQTLKDELEQASNNASNQEELEELKDQIQILQDSLVKVENEKIDLQECIEKFEAEKATHAQNVAATTHEADIDVYKEEVENLNTVIQHLRDKLSEYQDQEDVRGLRSKELSSLRKHVVVLEAETEKLQDELTKRDKANENLTAESKKLETELGDLRTEKKDLVQNLAVARAQVTRLREDLVELRNSFDSVSEKLEDRTLELQTMTLERDAAVTKLQNAAPVDQMIELQKEISGLNSRLRNEKSRQDDLLKKQESKFRTLLDELESKCKDLELELKNQTLSNPLNGLPENALLNGLAATESLRLVVDAIARTNLDALSTVDRVRLQGALHDLKAESSLETLQKLLNHFNRP